MHKKHESEKLENNGESLSESVAKVEQLVREAWQESDRDKARFMIDLMVKAPSAYWLDLLAKAEVHQIPHWQLLLDHADQLYEIAAEAVAGKDGLVVIKKKTG